MRRARADRRRRGGMASVEFALAVPLLVLLVVGASDIVGTMRAQLRVEMVARQLGQLVSQCNRIVAPGDIDQFWTYAQAIAGNAGRVSGGGAEGTVIISAVGLVGGASRVAWQARTGSASHASRIGTALGTATVPGGFSVPTGQTLFAVEVFLPRTTWPNAGAFMGGGAPRTLSGSSLFLTRATDAPSLQTLHTNTPAPACTA